MEIQASIIIIHNECKASVVYYYNCQLSQSKLSVHHRVSITNTLFHAAMKTVTVSNIQACCAAAVWSVNSGHVLLADSHQTKPCQLTGNQLKSCTSAINQPANEVGFGTHEEWKVDGDMDGYDNFMIKRIHVNDKLDTTCNKASYRERGSMLGKWQLYFLFLTTR